MKLLLGLLATVLISAMSAQASPSCSELRILKLDLAVRASNIRSSCKLGGCELLGHADFRSVYEPGYSDSAALVSYPEIYPQGEIAVLNSIARKLVALERMSSCGAKVSGASDI